MYYTERKLKNENKGGLGTWLLGTLHVTNVDLALIQIQL